MVKLAKERLDNADKALMERKLRKKNNHDIIQALALFSLVFFGFYFVFSSINFESYDEDSVDIVALDRKVDKAVNKSLRKAFGKTQLRDLEVNTERVNLTHKFKERFQEDSKAWLPVTKDSTDLYEEDMSSNEINLSSLSVEAQLRDQITAKKESEKQNERQKKEYIKAYKENAKKDGWVVELNDNLEVISAKPTKF